MEGYDENNPSLTPDYGTEGGYDPNTNYNQDMGYVYQPEYDPNTVFGAQQQYLDEEYANSMNDSYANQDAYGQGDAYIPENTYTDNVTYFNPDYNTSGEFDNTAQEPELVSVTGMDDFSGFEPLTPEGAFEEANEDVVTNTTDNEVPDYEELTPEEQERAKRREAAIRRRKLEAREQRRRKRRIQAITRCSILLIAVILVITGFVKMVSGIASKISSNKKSHKTTEESTEDLNAPTTEAEVIAEIDEAICAKEIPTDREAAMAILSQQAQTDPQIKDICDNAAVYTDELIRNVAANTEMKQFLIDYPAKINIVFDGETPAAFTPGTVPLYIQYDEAWGYADYGKSILGIHGAGPTCLSMACVYLKQDGTMNPIKVADYATEQGYLDDERNTTWKLMSDGAVGLGLGSTEITPDKDVMVSALQQGNVIICAMISGDFTKGTHFVVIRDYHSGLFFVNDPASEARSQVGWDFKRLASQTANMWVISANNDNPADSSDNSDSSDNAADIQSILDNNPIDNEDSNYSSPYSASENNNSADSTPEE